MWARRREGPGAHLPRQSFKLDAHLIYGMPPATTPSDACETMVPRVAGAGIRFVGWGGKRKEFEFQSG